MHLSYQLARADLRAAPERTAATAVLLGAASLLPALLSLPSSTGLVLSLCIAVAASAGTLALHERRRAILDRNGGGRVADAALMVAGMVPPAVLAALGAALLSLLMDPRPDVPTVVLVSGIVPLLATGVATLLGYGDDPARPRVRRRWWWRALQVLVGAAILLATSVVSPALPFALGAFLLMRKPGRGVPRRPIWRWIGVLIAAAVLLYTAWVAGRAGTWFDLALILLLLGPGVVVSVGLLGAAWIDTAAGAAGRLGPRARIALGPLRARRSSLGPTYGLLAVVAALAAMQATVGASFGQREDDRGRTLPTVTAPAGSDVDQAIVVVPPVDPSGLRATVADVTDATSARAVVIEQVGVGRPGRPGRGGLLGDVFDGAGTVRLAGSEGTERSGWLGVVAPEDVPLLGWEVPPDALSAGGVVVTPAGPAIEGGEAEIATPTGVVRRPVTRAAGRPGGAELPGGLVSGETAAALSSALLTSRVVVVPEPGGTVAAEELRTIAAEIGARAGDLPPLDLPGLVGPEAQIWGFEQALRSGPGWTDPEVFLGDEVVVLYESGPLNEVPYLASTRAAGRDQLLGLLGLALLMSVAVVVLAVGATEREDEVYRVQGAPDGLRAAIAAVQAAVLAGSTAAFAVVVGVGVPALAFRTYNGHADLPEIPLVVPQEVALLLALPVLAAGASAGLVAWRSRGRASSPRPVDELLW